MDFDLGEDAERFRGEVRLFLREHLTEDVIERAWRTGTMHDWGFHRAMAGRGWIAPHWPAALGGQGRSDYEMVALNEELAAAHAPVDGLQTTMLVAETLRNAGTEEQKRSLIPRVLRGEILICLGYSEPESGSDVAAARTRAVRDGSGWIINGQKMFTTLAHEAAYIFLLTRTEPEAPKHRGLTVFLVPMDAAGLEFTPIETLGGQLVNVTYLNNVRVPDTLRVGEVDGGWDVMTVGLAYERTVPFGPGPMLEQVVHWAREATDERGRPILGDPDVRAELARTAIDTEVARLLFYRSVWVAAQGTLPGVEGSMAKLYAAEAYMRRSASLLDALAPAALIKPGAEGSVADGAIERSFRYSPYFAIAGGTSEIQREIIAGRGLGLPRLR